MINKEEALRQLIELRQCAKLYKTLYSDQVLGLTLDSLILLSLQVNLPPDTLDTQDNSSALGAVPYGQSYKPGPCKETPTTVPKRSPVLTVTFQLNSPQSQAQSFSIHLPVR